MSKLIGIAALITTALGGWLYGDLNAADCMSGARSLEASYQRNAGAFGPGELMSGLKTIEYYCEAGDTKMASTILAHLSQNCRREGGCG